MKALLLTVGLALIGSVLSFGNGVNLQPSYYNNGDVTFGWDLMKKYSEIQTVRIEIEPDKVEQAWNWIHEAVTNGYEVIATYHKCSVLGSDNDSELMAGANWWVTNYAHLSSAGDFTINMMNEWGSHYQTPASFSNAYNSAIAKVRSVYQGRIIIDIPGWGQETQTAAEAAPMIADGNIVLSTHVYPQGWNEAAKHPLRPEDMDVLASSGRPFIVGEYGTHSGVGPVDVMAVIDRAQEVGCLAALAWAWNGDGGEYNMLLPTWMDAPQAEQYSESSYFYGIIVPL